MTQNGAHRLSGKVALVTGALRGIGLAVTERFLAEGAKVVLTDLKADDDPEVAPLLARLGANASYFQMNVAEEADWKRVEARVRANQGALHVLVNNAGVDAVCPVDQLEFAAWRRVMSINCDGVFLGIKTFTPLMTESGTAFRGGASIINVSSIMGIVGYIDTTAYNASKGAVRLLSKSAAIEFARKRIPIRVNSLHPGFVFTPLLDIGMQRYVDKGAAQKVDDLIAGLAEATPNGRVADASEIAAAAFFLASEDASYMTGAELVIDGGWTAQ
ncbi:MAG: SDR family oxidoreductase [Caulobacterales bacterium]